MKKLVLAAVLAATVYGGWRWQQTDPVETSSKNLVFNRLWIDHLPASERDAFNVLILSKPESMGGFAQETLWHGEIERFRFEAHGEEIRAVFPWKGDREQLRVKATACDEAEMDYCLDITGSKRGVSRYYSRNGWERRGMDDVDAFVRELRTR